MDDLQLPTWSDEQIDRYERARDLVSAMVALLADAAASATDEATRGPLEQQQDRYRRERDTITPGDATEIDRILRDYPSLLRRPAAG